jgi:hypothetical protein
MFVRRGGAVLLLIICAMLGAGADVCSQARADDDGGRPQQFEAWTGAQAYRHVWSAYTGVTIAPFGTIEHDGWRLRIVGGYGADRYAGPSGTRFKAATSFADVLAGYHSQLGPLTVKVFAGAAMLDRQIEPDDPVARIRGTDLGGKAALETWLNLGDRAWAAVDLSWASLHQDYSGRLRLGWRLTPGLSSGIEVGAVGNFDADVLRTAAFLRYETASGEVSLTAGVSNDTLLSGNHRLDADQITPFAMLSWLQRF